MCTIAPTFAFTFYIKYPRPSHLIVQEMCDIVYTRGLYVVVLVIPVGLRSRAAFYCYRRPLLEGGIWAGNPYIMYATDAGQYIIAFIRYYYLLWYVGIRAKEGYTTSRDAIWQSYSIPICFTIYSIPIFKTIPT